MTDRISEERAASDAGEHQRPEFRPYHHPAAGWGAARSVARVLARELVDGPRAMLRMNHEDKGFDCPGCAWPDDQKGLHLDICENGIKHVTWEMTRKRVGAEFFAAHTVTELRRWSDFALEDQGRLTEPMRYDADTDHYVPIAWDDAFALVGDDAARARQPGPGVVLHLGPARQRGNVPLPAVGARVRHEQPAGLLEHVPRGERPRADGVDRHRQGHGRPGGLGAGRRDLRDRRQRGVERAADAHRAGRGVPARRAGRARQPARRGRARRTIVPHDFLRDGDLPRDHDRHAQRAAAHRRRPRADARRRQGGARDGRDRPEAIDREFIDAPHRGLRGVPALRARRRRGTSSSTSRASTRRRSARSAEIYLRVRPRRIISWCLGVTQQEHGVDTVREIVNLLLLRGNIGRRGRRARRRSAGTATSRATAPAASTTARAERSSTGSPRSAASTRRASTGWTPCARSRRCTRGDVKVFVGMGGNFVLAAPDTALHLRGAARLRADRAGQHEAEPQPPRARPRRR